VTDEAPPMRAPPAEGLIVEGRNIITTSIHSRPPAERPVADSFEQISEWLVGPARGIASFTEMFDEFCWRLHAAGARLLRASIHGGTLHPQFLGVTYMWWRDIGETREVMITHGVADLIPFESNVVRRVREGGETVRRRIEPTRTSFDFSVLRDLQQRGATDYLAFPLASLFGFGNYMLAFASDRPGGFADAEIADLDKLAPRLSVNADMNTQRQIAGNVMRAYLGPRTGPRVLAGQIRRGGGEAISAVLWSSDLRGFTHLSDHAPGDRVIAILNDLFDLQARRIARHGGEILKFVGDGLLAIFPVATPGDAPRAAADALEAARETLADLAARLPADGEAPPRIVIALHYGSVIYGNIGSSDRLDFTVIGPAVNLVSRVEAVAKALDLPLVVSDDFAEIHGDPLPSIGAHNLRGLQRPHELFAPSTAAVAVS
jgi:adenylate cyclase